MLLAVEALFDLLYLQGEDRGDLESAELGWTTHEFGGRSDSTSNFPTVFWFLPVQSELTQV